MKLYFKEDRAFIDSIKSSKKPFLPGKGAVHISEVPEAVKESLKKGKAIKVKRHFQSG